MTPSNELSAALQIMLDGVQEDVVAAALREALGEVRAMQLFLRLSDELPLKVTGMVDKVCVLDQLALEGKRFVGTNEQLVAAIKSVETDQDDLAYAMDELAGRLESDGLVVDDDEEGESDEQEP
jgi:hypothetical protein